MIGLNNAGQLVAVSWSGTVVRVMGPVVPANSWTHVVSTYSRAHGLQIYSNGTAYNSSSPFSFQASGVPNYLFVGSPRAGIDCRSLTDISGQYSGAVDELQVYSRELSSADINILATR